MTLNQSMEQLSFSFCDKEPTSTEEEIHQVLSSYYKALVEKNSAIRQAAHILINYIPKCKGDSSNFTAVASSFVSKLSNEDKEYFKEYFKELALKKD